MKCYDCGIDLIESERSYLGDSVVCNDCYDLLKKEKVAEYRKMRVRVTDLITDLDRAMCDDEFDFAPTTALQRLDDAVTHLDSTILNME